MRRQFIAMSEFSLSQFNISASLHPNEVWETIRRQTIYYMAEVEFSPTPEYL